MHLKGIAAAIVCCLAAGSQAVASQVLELTFSRTGTGAQDVAVTASGIDGVTASMTAVSHSMRPTTENVTAQILCPNVNGNTSPTITMEFRIQGLPAGFTVEDLNLDIHALNGTSTYQQHDDGKLRQFNVSTTLDGTAFGSLSNIDIAANVNPSGSERHKVWTIEAASPVATSSTVNLKLTVTKGTTNEGCFFGISSIRFNTPAPEVRPFTPASSVGNATDFYYILNADGQALTSSMQWDEKKPDDGQKWYFVGASNAAGGYQIVAGANDAIQFSGKKFTVDNGSESGLYTLTDAEGTALEVAGCSEFRFGTFRQRNQFALSSQIYSLPCGSLGSTYVASAIVKSLQGYADLHYPMATVSGQDITYPTASRPTERYTMLSRHRATVAAGEMEVQLNLNATPSAADKVYLCFDWDRDGYFEHVQEIAPSQAMKATVQVPATAKTGLSRMRVRITSNGLADADDDVVGQVLDMFLEVVDAQASLINPQVIPNAPERGTATYNETTGIASATAKGTAAFLYWSEGLAVYSLDAQCEISPAYTARKYVAVFSPNLDELSAIDRVAWNTPDAQASISVSGRTVTVESPADVNHIMVFGLNGSLLLHVQSVPQVSVESLASGLYIIKAVTSAGSVSAKAIIE
ncbi:MAG: T9SS type A sorting domain-containing protein [Paramuribaculum sp.]|nr:T9SS type A sorting domain-containing protein [Paramuribaculum sp.]